MLSPVLFRIALRVQSMLKTRRKRQLIWKEVKLPLFPNNMITYVRVGKFFWIDQNSKYFRLHGL